MASMKAGRDVHPPVEGRHVPIELEEPVADTQLRWLTADPKVVPQLNLVVGPHRVLPPRLGKIHFSVHPETPCSASHPDRLVLAHPCPYI